MRRKSSRNTRNSSPEKTKLESQRKSRRQSSRRRKRSTSRSSEDSDEQPDAIDSVQSQEQHITAATDASTENDEETAKLTSINIDTNQDDTNTESQPLEKEFTASGQECTSVLNKVDKDSQERKEEIEDMEVKKNKGKSKGKNKSNFEQSSINIEHETENENVQGTPQSPSNDYADNENVVQNVNDTAKVDINTEEGNIKEDSVVVSGENLQGQLEESFVSEYTQINEGYQKNEDIVESNKTGESEREKFDKSKSDSSQMNDNESSSHKEKSTTPERKTSEEDLSENLSDKNQNDVPEVPKEDSTKSERFENSGTKKKITLRRSPLQNEETEQITPVSTPKVRRSNSVGENKKQDENKTSKKIVLKRHTTDESKISENQENNKKDTVSHDISDVEKRRLSSASDNKEQDEEDKPKKILKRIKLIRNSFREDTEDDEKKSKKVDVRRQKWGRSDWLNKLTSSFYKVDVESIKIVCPGLEFLSESEINLEPTPKEQKHSEGIYKRKVSVDNKSEDSDRPEYEKQTSEDSSGEPKTELNPNIIAMNRKISIVDDTASKLRPPPSPAKNPASDVLFITNLVRPFTVKQLKELLERTGKINEEGFWTDRIKSKCYVQYESIEEAEATRDALHGVHWPIGNGKKLVIDYATVEDLQKAKNPTPTPVHVPEKVPEKENREPEKEDVKFKDKDREERRKRDPLVREWDLGKEDPRSRRFSRSRSRERARKHSRRSYTPEEYINSKKHRKADDSIPQKLMDDLFLKTKATPSIYWQPLSPEEITTKQQQRLVRMEEHKRRIEETRGRVIRDNRRPPPFRKR